ncbi:MAG TPA: ABC transporter, partial [Verrucomicrobiales bacterium]|nr:ABC transporter [Verrucomicrobiales bacterium]
KDDDTYLEKLLVKLQLFEKKDNIIKSLSGGMKRRVMIAKALSHNPQILFLDEPTIGLDIVSQKTVRDFLKDLNKTKKTTIILTSHYMADIQELCKRVLIIDHGKLFYDGELQGILDQFADEKRINVLFEDPSMPLPEKCKSIGSIESFADGKLQIRVNRKAVVQASKDLLDMLPVADLNIEEVPIEEIIRKIYAESNSV